MATVIARGAGVLIYLWIFLSGRAIVKLRMSTPIVDFSMMWRIARLGIFASLQAILRSVSGVVLMPIVARYGTFAIAASGIGMRLQMIVMMPAFGLAGAVSTLVGQNLGAAKPERAERSAWITAGIGAAIMTFFGAAYIAFARDVIAFFNDDPEVIRIGVEYMYIIAGTLGFIGLSIILGRALNGAGDTVSPMVITAIGFIGLRISLAFLFSSSFGLRGIWSGVAVSTIIQGLMVVFWFNTGRWKLKQV
jgi:putative MATE family efflux protein